MSKSSCLRNIELEVVSQDCALSLISLKGLRQFGLINAVRYLAALRVNQASKGQRDNNDEGFDHRVGCESKDH